MKITVLGIDVAKNVLQLHGVDAQGNIVVRKQFPARAALVDLWWQGVGQDGEPCVLSPRWQQGVHAGLLPRMYGDEHVPRTRCRRRHAKRQQALAKARGALERHAITKRLASQVRTAWTAWATDRGNVLQRAASAVAGRHRDRSHMPHHQRGLPKQRDKVWTILQNFACHAAEGTTPASRFFRRTFPALLETVWAPSACSKHLFGHQALGLEPPLPAGEGGG